MNRHTTKLNQQEQEQNTSHHQQTSQMQTTVQFATAEEMLRHDAAHTEVPPTVAERLQTSVESEARPPTRPWWRRLFGG